MSDTMRLTLQLTAIDMLSGVLSGARRYISSLGQESQKVQKDFDRMTVSVKRSMQAFAGAAFLGKKLKSGVDAAASLQEAMGDVRMDITKAGESTTDLNRKLAQVRATAVSIQQFSPFGTEDVVHIEDTLLKAGLRMKDVAGKGGAAWAATALATITGNAPDEMAEGLVHIAAPYNIGGAGYGTLADQLQRVATAGGMGMSDVMEGMTFSAGQAAQMGISLNNTLAMLASVHKLTGMSGGRSGRNLQMFLTMLNGVNSKSRAYMQALGINAYDAAGHIKPVVEIIRELRAAFSKMSAQQQQIAAHELFGQEGARVAFALLNQGQYSYETIVEHMRDAEGLQGKINQKTSQYLTNLHAMETTTKSTMATMFSPMLAPLTHLFSVLNDIAGKLGEIGEKYKTLPKVASTAAVGGVALLGGIGIWKAIQALRAGKAVLSGIGMKGLLGSLGGTAVGVTEGKALQAAAGVTPVFVTNWPSNFGGGAAALERIAAPGIGSALRTGFSRFPWAAIGAAAGPVLAVSLGAAVGGLIGKELYEHTKVGREWGDWAGGELGKVREAVFGHYGAKLPTAVQNEINIYTNTGKVTTNSNGMQHTNHVNLRRGHQ